MLIAEDLLLLLTRDDTGRPLTSSPALPYGLAGALLTELALAGRVDIAGTADPVKAGRIVVRDSSSTDDPVLDEALTVVVERAGKRPQDALSKLHKGLRDKLYTRLADRGLVRRDSGKVLGLFPRTSWPAADVAHEQQVHAAITQALVHDVAAEAHVGALIGLLSATNTVTKVVDPDVAGVSKRDLNRRAKAMADQSWTSTAVRKAIQAAASTVAAGGSVAATSGSC